MSTTIANISWDFVPGSLSTLVEYKQSTSSVWLSPSSPNNPTITNTYPLVIENNVIYDVRLTTNGIRCGPRSTTFQIINPAGCCPVGYTLSDDLTYCFQTNTTAATPPASPENTVAKTNTNYGLFGTLIYDPGYNIDGSGTAIQINPSNSFWVNGTGYPSGSGSTTVDGPNNRTGLWSITTLNNQDVGFTICVDAPTDGTYYVGSFADNFIIIDVDGVNVLTMIPTAMRDFLNSNGFPGQDLQVTFRWWHIYPISLTAGFHVINVTGHNDTSVAAMGVEVYNLTSAQLQAATSYVAMGSGLLFSSKDFIGQPVQIGTGGFGYTCAAGYSLVLCDGPAYCTQTLTTAIIPCTTTTTTTTTTTSTTTTTTTT
jgi:hypothetical protein